MHNIVRMRELSICNVHVSYLHTTLHYTLTLSSYSSGPVACRYPWINIKIKIKSPLTFILIFAEQIHICISLPSSCHVVPHPRYTALSLKIESTPQSTPHLWCKL